MATPRADQRTLHLFLAGLVAGLITTAGVFSQGPPGQGRVDVLINFMSAPGPADRALVTAAGGRIKFVYAIVPAIAANLPEAAIAGLAANPRVRFIEPDSEVEAVDTELDNTWGVKKIGAGAAQNSGTTGAGVRVAIIDTGIDYTHPDLAPNYAGGWDFYANDADPMDDCGHGTHVAGTVAARRDGIGVVGVAPTVMLYALKALGPSTGNKCAGPWSAILAAVDWAAQNGMQIANHSYGSTAPSATADQAYANAAALGVLHVAAAMNSGTCDGTGNNVGYPAGYRSVIAVANVDINDVRNCTSSTGPDVEVSAPGTQVNSTLWGGGYGLKGGTSMASPHVAGTAALLVGQPVVDANASGWTGDEIRNAIARSTIDLGAAGRDPLYGFGRIDAPAALAAAAAAPPLTVSVDTIGYTPTGNGKNKKDLTITIGTVYGLAAPTPATVSFGVYVNGLLYASAIVSTDQNGLGSKLLRNVPDGNYTTRLNSIQSAGLAWDGTTPPNSFVK